MTQHSKEDLERLTRQVEDLISSMAPPIPLWVGALGFTMCVIIAISGIWLLFSLIAAGISSAWAQALCYIYVGIGGLFVLWMQRFLAKREYKKKQKGAK
jgi:uncharacterized protein involved in cysteine biosynthesis